MYLQYLPQNTLVNQTTKKNGKILGDRKIEILKNYVETMRPTPAPIPLPNKLQWFPYQII